MSNKDYTEVTKGGMGGNVRKKTFFMCGGRFGSFCPKLSYFGPKLFSFDFALFPNFRPSDWRTCDPTGGLYTELTRF